MEVIMVRIVMETRIIVVI